MITRSHPTGAKRNSRSGIAFRRFCQDVLLWEISNYFANGGFLLRICQD
jgi:hypothetical protein